MSIPTQPGNAIIFPLDNSVTPSNLCKPPPEGFKFMSFQLNSNTKFPALIDIASLPAPPISQLCSIYVDATNSGGDITIIFIDSGYQVVIESGNSLLFPVLTSTQLPKFIISSSIGGMDTVNVFLINQFVPEFGTQIFQKVLSFGNDAVGNSDKISYPAETFASQIDFGIQSFPIPIGGVFATPKTVICGLQIYLMAQASVASQTNVIRISQDATIGVPNSGNTIWKIPVLITNTLQRLTVIETGQLLNARAEASIHGPPFIEIDSTTNLTTSNVYCNVQIGRNNS